MFGAEPEFVAGADVAPDRSGAAAVDEANHSFAVHGERDGFAEFQVAEPLFLGVDVGVFSGIERIHVEEKKDELETRTDVVEALALRCVFFLQEIEIVGADAFEDLGFAALEFDDLSVFVGDDGEEQFVEIGEARAARVFAPVIGLRSRTSCWPAT